MANKNQKAKGVEEKATPDVRITTEEVDMGRIRVPDENPARADHCNSEIVERYRGMIAEHMSEWKKYEHSDRSKPAPKFPLAPLKVKWIEPDEDGCDLEVIAGCHTCIAACEAGLERIDVEIYEGSDEDLLILAIRDNAGRGLSYKRNDIRHNILNLRKQNQKMSIYRIAEIVGCSKSLVSNIINQEKQREQGSEEEEENVEEMSTSGQKSRSASGYNRKRFAKSLLRMVEKHVESFEKDDMFELAKFTGRVFRMLDEKGHPDLRDDYYDALMHIVNPDLMDHIDLDGDLFFLEDMPDAKDVSNTEDDDNVDDTDDTIEEE